MRVGFQVCSVTANLDRGIIVRVLFVFYAGRTVNRPIRSTGVKNEPKCAELDKVDWTIDSLKNVTLGKFHFFPCVRMLESCSQIKALIAVQ